MKKILMTTVALLLACGASASDRRGMRVLEDGREVEAATLTLPSQALGRIEIKGCATCALISLNLQSTTRFFIGKSEVSLGELKTHINAHPSAAVVVVSPVSQNVVSRIVAPAIGPQQTAAK